MKKIFSLPLAATLLLPMMSVFAQEVDDLIAIPSLSSIPPTTYYYLAGIVVFIIIYFLFTKIAKKKGDTFTAGQFAEFEQKSDAEKQAMLEPLFKEDWILYALHTAVEGAKIVGLRQCFPFQTMKGAIKQGAKILGKQALWSVVGVKATYYDAGKYYLVLTEKKLHYLSFDKHSELNKNFSFSLSQLMGLTLKNATAKEMMKYSMDNTENYFTREGGKVLEFEYDGEKMQFIYCGQSIVFPNMDVNDAEQRKNFANHYQALSYLDTIFQKKLEEKAGI